MIKQNENVLLYRSIFLYLGQIFLLILFQFFFTFNLSLISFLFSDNLTYSILLMISQIDIFNIFTAIIAFLCFAATELVMFIDFVKLNFFLTKFTMLWFLTTTQIVSFKSIITCCKTTLFAFHFFMIFFIVIIFVSFGHAHVAFLTFVILS